MNPSSRAISALCPEMQVKANQFLTQCMAEGIHAIITQTYRNEVDQNSDWARGRSISGAIIGKIITNARYGQSPHNCVDSNGNPAARAFDFAIELNNSSLDWNGSDEAWLRALDIGRALGIVSGEDWKCNLKDEPHFELPNWRTYNQDSYAPLIGISLPMCF